VERQAKIGVLVRIKVSGRAKDKDGKWHKLPKNDIGMIVEKDLWPDGTWEDRNSMQLDAPFVRILFSRAAVLVPTSNFNQESLFEILQKEKDL
jgi:hypothetical protein